MVSHKRSAVRRRDECPARRTRPPALDARHPGARDRSFRGRLAQLADQPAPSTGGRRDATANTADAGSRHEPKQKKAGVVPLVHCRGLCIPLWAVFPPLQVVLSSACSVASLSRFPSHYLPGHPHLREGALAAYLFGQGSPSTWFTGLTAVHDTPSAKLPCGAQRGMTLPRCTFGDDKMQVACSRVARAILVFFCFS